MRAFTSCSSKLDLKGATLVLVRCLPCYRLKPIFPTTVAHPTTAALAQVLLGVFLCLCLVLQPAVAFANIGELSIDLLVCTLKAQPVARLDSDNLLACVGNNAYELQPSGLLATALELYQVPGKGTEHVSLYRTHPAW
jgi:hypothetical protein